MWHVILYQTVVQVGAKSTPVRVLQQLSASSIDLPFASEDLHREIVAKSSRAGGHCGMLPSGHIFFAVND